MKWENIDSPFYTMTPVGTYDPLASTVLKLDDFVWPDCPFSDDDVKESDFGIIVDLITCFTLLVIMALTSMFIWRKYWHFKVLPLDHRAPFSQSDLQ
jgi:hypothetical protein